VLAFAGLIVAGTVLLLLTGRRDGATLSLLEAAFTSTSAVCVTGLSVVDVGKELGFDGQVVLVILMQLGGLGVLTLSNWILLVLRGRWTATTSAATQDAFGGLPLLSPPRLLARVMLFTFTFESLGAAILLWRFSATQTMPDAIWMAVFHSVSAFCNAGFSLFSDSLVGYSGDVVVNGVVMGLIFVGGIGFFVAADVGEWLRSRARGRRRLLSFHSHVALRTSLILTLVGAGFFLLFELGNTLAGASPLDMGLQPLFLSVTARTAGFNTVDTGALTNMSMLALMLLMFVGASPGSTGGGVKTTSMAIVWARVWSYMRNRRDAELLGHRIPHATVSKAMALVVIYVLLVLLAMLALQATELGELPHDQVRGAFLEYLFEVISAMSTVGLSTGVTGHLSGGGQVVIMLCMFAGRVGPLVLAATLIKDQAPLLFRRPQGPIMVG